jgi:hypothetical protein
MVKYLVKLIHGVPIVLAGKEISRRRHPLGRSNVEQPTVVIFVIFPCKGVDFPIACK